MRNVFKYSGLAIMLIIVGIAVSACANNGGGGGGGASNTPEGAVKAWFDAALSGNADGVRAETCASGQESVDQVADSFGAMSEGGEVDGSGLTFTKASEEGDRATVNVGGTIKVTVAGTSVDQPMTDLTVPLVKENGAWKVCDV